MNGPILEQWYALFSFTMSHIEIFFSDSDWSNEEAEKKARKTKKNEKKIRRMS